MCRSLLLACLALAILLPGQMIAAPPPDFDTVVAPLLARACLDCHRGAKPKGGLDLSRAEGLRAGGKNGPALVPGKLDESPLWARVRDGEMPPSKPLADVDRQVLRAWVEAGARWGDGPIDPFRITTDRRAGYDWWSLRPVRRPALPAVKQADWCRTPIDSFVLARLEKAGLAPSGEADRRTLIRRLSFDLLGLPPTIDEVRAFVDDPRPDAYERLVERTLASPHYGERWARHWLDVVRFGESHGFERDQPRPNAWPYRDWVVQAFNNDLPFEEFVRQQIAGDVLQPRSASAVVATGFLVAGPHDIVIPSSERMRMTMEQDELEDLIGVVGQSFLGLTINCARCHDHKFDPISQKDYYRLVATLAGAQAGERPLPEEEGPALARLRQRADALARQIEEIDAPFRNKLLAERRTVPERQPPVPLAEWDFTVDLKDHRGDLHGQKFGEARQDKEGLHLDGKTGYVATEPLTRDLEARTLEAWVRLDHLKQQGGGVIGIQTREGVVFDSLVFGEQEPGRWMAGSNFFKRTQSLRSPVEDQADKQAVHVALVYAADGTITAYRQGQPWGKPYPSGGVVAFKARESQIIFGVRHFPAGSNKMLAGTILRARLHDRALTADEVAASAGVVSDHVPPEQIVAGLPEQERARRAELTIQLRQAQAERDLLKVKQVAVAFAVTPRVPPPTRLLIRGNVAEPGEAVSAGPPAALPALEWKEAVDVPEGQRRVALAQWLSAPGNPLPVRVMVNRLWHHHFGTGLVDTPNDFGFNGGRPSHPELLEWLASELRLQNGSLKALHRVMVLSATYRQASQTRPEAKKIDSGNRLLWSRAPQRLEAEAVRDAMLRVSGRLDPRLGGPGYQDFRSFFFKGTQFYEPIEQVGPEFARRSLYRQWARGGRNPFLDTFDCPDPSITTPRRASTTTPLQALALLNNAFVLDCAAGFAERLRAEAGNDAAAQVRLAYELAYGRPADEVEVEIAKPFVARHGLAAYCRALFNTNEFIHVD